jgi:hypothetical protein
MIFSIMVNSNYQTRKASILLTLNALKNTRIGLRNGKVE